VRVNYSIWGWVWSSTRASTHLNPVLARNKGCVARVVTAAVACCSRRLSQLVLAVLWDISRGGSACWPRDDAFTPAPQPCLTNQPLAQLIAKFHYTDTDTGQTRTKSAHVVGYELNSTTRTRHGHGHGLFCGETPLGPCGPVRVRVRVRVRVVEFCYYTGRAINAQKKLPRKRKCKKINKTAACNSKSATPSVSVIHRIKTRSIH